MKGKYSLIHKLHFAVIDSYWQFQEIVSVKNDKKTDSEVMLGQFFMFC